MAETLVRADLPIADARDGRWDAILSGRIRPEYDCLALRILMIRLTHAYQRVDADRVAVIEELRRFFRDNARFAGADYRTLFGGEVAR